MLKICEIRLSVHVFTMKQNLGIIKSSCSFFTIIFQTLLTGLDAIIALGGDKDDFYDITSAMDTDLLDYLALVGRSYYHYKGSLTTPTCNEVVDWIVLENAIDITEADMAKFRMLLTEDNAPMVDNFRNPQPINNRFVKRVFN